MSKSNVHKGGMNIDRMLAQLTDREVDKLLDGRYPVQGHDIEALVAAIEKLRSAQGDAQPQVGADLAAVFSHGLAADGSAPPEWALPPDPDERVPTVSWRARLRTRTTRAMTVLGVPLGTLAGNLMIAAAVAAAGIAGFYAAGVVGVPGLPDRPFEIDPVRDQDHTPAPDDAEKAGNAGPQDEDAGDVQDEDRGQGIDGGDRSEPATTGVPPSDGTPAGQSSPGPGKSAQTDTDAAGESSKAAKKAAEKAEKAEKKADKAEKKAKKAKGGKKKAPKEEQ